MSSPDGDVGAPWLDAPCPTCGGDVGRYVEAGPHVRLECAGCAGYVKFVAKTELGLPQRSVRSRPDISPSLRSLVILRAGRSCETCNRTDVPLHVGHVISRDEGQRQGWTDAELDHEENLLAQCEECNLGQGTAPVPVRVLLRIVRARLRRTERP